MAGYTQAEQLSPPGRAGSIAHADATARSTTREISNADTAHANELWQVAVRYATLVTEAKGVQMPTDTGDDSRTTSTEGPDWVRHIKGAWRRSIRDPRVQEAMNKEPDFVKVIELAVRSQRTPTYVRAWRYTALKYLGSLYVGYSARRQDLRSAAYYDAMTDTIDRLLPDDTGDDPALQPVAETDPVQATLDTCSALTSPSSPTSHTTHSVGWCIEHYDELAAASLARADSARTWMAALHLD